MTTFTNPLDAIDEAAFMATLTGVRHAVVQPDRATQIMIVMPAIAVTTEFVLEVCRP